MATATLFVLPATPDRMRALLVIGLLATLALAGCTSGNGGSPSASPSPSAAASVNPKSVEVTTGLGTVTSAGVAGTSFSNGAPAVTFDVKANATLIYIEMRWASPVVDLDIAMSSPNSGNTQGVGNPDYIGSGGGPGTPDSPATMTLKGGDVIKGGWTGGAFANGAAAQQDYEMAVSVFYGAKEVPSGYTGFSS